MQYSVFRMTHSIYSTIGVLLKDSDSAKSALEAILPILRNYDIGVYIHEDTPFGNLPTFSRADDVECIIVIGGDGTIIRTLRELQSYKVPVISINAGTVGFMADIRVEQACTMLPTLLQGESTQDIRSLLHVELYKHSERIFQTTALNDVVLAQGKIARLIDIQVLIDNQYVTDYLADGLLISTPSGSTAYNLSAGGPIVHPSVTAMIVTAINPYSLSQKPIVVPSSSHIILRPRVKNVQETDEAVYLTIDGQQFIEVEPTMEVRVRLSEQTLTFLRIQSHSYFETLRTKLKWGDKPTINLQ